MENSSLVSFESIGTKIILIRGERVMIDQDLAELYGVKTGALNRAVKRNIERFPDDFMFQLSMEGWNILKCQFGISRSSHGGRRKLPHAFTEQGISMLSSLLNSKYTILKRIILNIEEYEKATDS